MNHGLCVICNGSSRLKDDNDVNAEHPWLREGGEASDKPIDSAVLSRMKQFRVMNKLKKLALKVCNL